MLQPVVILVPVLRRPRNVQPLVDCIAENTSLPHRVLFITDPGDKPEMEAIDAVGGDRITVDGNYARKINEGVRRTEEPLIFLAADDLYFHPDWLEHAIAKLHPRVGVVGTNDLGNPLVMQGKHSTHSLVTRDYAARGTIDDKTKLLHEGYPHEFVDDEFIGTARLRNAFRFAQKSHVEHLHPDWGKGKTDALYRAAPRRFELGRDVYNQRRHLWRGPMR